MTDIKATLDDRIARIMANINGTLPGLLKNGVLEAAQHIEGEIKNVLFGLPSKSGGKLYMEIANSFHAQFIEDKGDIISAGAFSNHIAADIHDTDRLHKNRPRHIIIPRQKKNLAIPISKHAKNTMMWPRHWGKTEGEQQLKFILNKNTGKKLLATVKGKGDKKKLEVHYVLVSKQRIKPKYYLKKADNNAREGVNKIMGKHVQTAIQTGIEITK